MRVITPTFFLSGFAFFLIGCQAPTPPAGPTQVTLHAPDREALVDTAAEVLRQRGFPLRRIDRTDGVIVSRPVTSQQWFEFWRHDALGPYQLLESSMHTIRRIVTVRVEPTGRGQSEALRVSVEVDKQRYSVPERQVTTTSGALAIYSERLPTTTGRRARTAAVEHWVPLGRDALLERALLDRIAASANARITPQTRPATTRRPSPPTTVTLAAAGS